MQTGFLEQVLFWSLRLVEGVFKGTNDVLPEYNRRPGGFFCIADGKTGLPLLVKVVGSPPEDKGEKYFSFAQEKARRLAKHPEHMSSWESRDPESDQWSGAVRYGGLIFSFSGLPELADEALILSLLHPDNWRGFNPDEGGRCLGYLKSVAMKSANPYF